jgi:hypothetical protein
MDDIWNSEMDNRVRALINNRKKELHRAIRSHNDLWSYACTYVFLFKETETIVVEIDGEKPIITPELSERIVGFCPRCW